MADLYLGGIAEVDWREQFRMHISDDITVFDPMIDGYESLSDLELSNQVARELYYIEECNLIIFYINNKWKGASTLLELGDAVGSDKSVIVCLDGKIKGGNKIKRYCEYRGVHVVSTIDELVMAAEEYLSQEELANTEESY